MSGQTSAEPIPSDTDLDYLRGNIPATENIIIFLNCTMTHGTSLYPIIHTAGYKILLASASRFF